MRRLLLALAVISGPVWAAPPQVVVDIAPIHALVAVVMQDVAEPELLIDRGGDAHDFQLRPSQASRLSEADLLIWVGPLMTPWLDHALNGLNVKATRLTLMDLPQTYLQPFGGGVHDHDAGEKGDHAHDGIDPHVWLDPENAQSWLPLIAAQLAALDPENAATYAANAQSAAGEIAALDAELTSQLAPLRDRSFVVFHDAYGYFTAHYGLHAAGSVRLGDAASPGAARLSALRNMLQKGDVACIFPEEGHDPALAAQFATPNGPRLGAALDPEATRLTPGPQLYAQMMHGIADSLAECLRDGP